MWSNLEDTVSRLFTTSSDRKKLLSDQALLVAHHTSLCRNQIVARMCLDQWGLHLLELSYLTSIIQLWPVIPQTKSYPEIDPIQDHGHECAVWCTVRLKILLLKPNPGILIHDTTLATFLILPVFSLIHL